MLDLGGISLHAADRSLAEPLVIAGGPCAQNPEPMADFIDIFVTGDGEPSLPRICDRWIELRQAALAGQGLKTGESRHEQRAAVLAELVKELPFCYAPRFYEPEYLDRRFVGFRRTRGDVPETIRALGDFGSRSNPAAHTADCAFCRVRSRPDCDRDHARLPMAVPILPKHRDQATLCESVRSTQSSTAR